MNTLCKKHKRTFHKVGTLIVLIIFLFNTIIPASAQNVLNLPDPGVRVNLSPAFTPPLLKGIKVYSNNPFRLDFILDTGDDKSTPSQLKEESTRLIKYFLASLTVPEKDLWVNLSPYEKDRITPDAFGITQMGRDLLAEDYLLKQITASVIYPESSTGKEFWDKVYAEAHKRYGTSDIPIDTFNKVWIIPQKAVVYENPTPKVGEATAFIVESHLKVMLEEDYLALSHNDKKEANAVAANKLGSQVVREVVIPILEKEVNEGKNFIQLRQVYHSLILATWFKRKIKDSILNTAYINQNKVSGVDISDTAEKDKIYDQYLKAFKQGVYNYIKEDYDPLTQETIPRKYFSGGVLFDAAQIVQVTGVTEKISSNRATGKYLEIPIQMLPTDGNASSGEVSDSSLEKEQKKEKDETDRAMNSLPTINKGFAGGERQFWLRYPQQMAEELLRNDVDNREMSILDLGSATGGISIWTATQSQRFRVLGLERDEKSIGAAQNKVQEQGLTNVRFLQADLSKAIPQATNSSDAVIMHKIRDSFPSPQARLNLLAETSRVLKLGGYVSLIEDLYVEPTDPEGNWYAQRYRLHAKLIPELVKRNFIDPVFLDLSKKSQYHLLLSMRKSDGGYFDDLQFVDRENDLIDAISRKEFVIRGIGVHQEKQSVLDDFRRYGLSPLKQWDVVMPEQPGENRGGHASIMKGILFQKNVTIDQIQNLIDQLVSIKEEESNGKEEREREIRIKMVAVNQKFQDAEIAGAKQEELYVFSAELIQLEQRLSQVHERSNNLETDIVRNLEESIQTQGLIPVLSFWTEKYLKANNSGDLNKSAWALSKIIWKNHDRYQEFFKVFIEQAKAPTSSNIIQNYPQDLNVSLIRSFSDVASLLSFLRTNREYAFYYFPNPSTLNTNSSLRDNFHCVLLNNNGRLFVGIVDENTENGTKRGLIGQAAENKLREIGIIGGGGFLIMAEGLALTTKYSTQLIPYVGFGILGHTHPQDNRWVYSPHDSTLAFVQLSTPLIGRPIDLKVAAQEEDERLALELSPEDQARGLEVQEITDDNAMLGLNPKRIQSLIENPETIYGGIRLLSTVIGKISSANNTQLKEIEDFFANLEIPRTQAVKTLANALIQRRRTQDLGGPADIRFIDTMEHLSEGGVLTREERFYFQQAKKFFAKGINGMNEAEARGNIRKIFDRLHRMIVLSDQIMTHPETQRDIFLGVDNKQGYFLAAQVQDDIPGMALLWDKGQPLAWQYHPDAAVTQPYFAIIINKNGFPSRVVIKDKNTSPDPAAHIGHIRGNRLLSAIGASYVWTHGGKKYVYIREIVGEDMIDFVGRHLRGLSSETQQKFFYALGAAMSTAHILGIEDRFRNLVINPKKLESYSTEELLTLEKNAIINIDREGCLTGKYLSKMPSADIFEARKTFLLTGEVSLAFQLTINNMDTYLKGFKDGYLYHRKYFLEHQDDVTKKLILLAEGYAPSVKNRLNINDSELDQLVMNIRQSTVNVIQGQWKQGYPRHFVFPQPSPVQGDSKSDLAMNVYSNGRSQGFADEKQVIDFLRQFPLVEGHVHFGSSVPGDTLWELAVNRNELGWDVINQELSREYDRKVDIKEILDEARLLYHSGKAVNGGEGRVRLLKDGFLNYVTFRMSDGVDLKRFNTIYKIIGLLTRGSPKLYEEIAKQIALANYNNGVKILIQRATLPVGSTEEDIYQKTIIKLNAVKNGFESAEKEVNSKIKNGDVGFETKLVVTVERYLDFNVILMQTRALLRILEERSDLRKFVIGFDVADNESLKSPTQMIPMSDLIDQYNHQRHLRGEEVLAKTYHVGEDFRHVSVESGIRHADEVIEMGATGIGHGLVLGVNPQRFFGKEKSEHISERLTSIYYDLKNVKFAKRELDAVVLSIGEDALWKELRSYGTNSEYIEHKILPLIAEITNAPKLDLIMERRLYDLINKMKALYPRDFIVIKYDSDAKIEELRKRQKFVLNKLIERQVVIESNPTLNVLIGPIKNYKEHPLPNLLSYEYTGIRNEFQGRRPIVTINTDNPTIVGIDLVHEYRQVIAAFNLTRDDVVQIILNGIKYRLGGFQLRFSDEIHSSLNEMGIHQNVNQVSSVGGIDLNPERIGLQVKGASGADRFYFDAAMMGNSKINGLKPFIIDIHPLMTSIPVFLGMKENIQN